ncbi:hypothetical protein C8Q79DRAFT_923145 [Trametes meyenii]|nr:hypothetical protein C8Q79DRAFT_923145 [Trametes meyenii]
MNSAVSAILGITAIAWAVASVAFLSLSLFSWAKARRDLRLEDPEVSEIELQDLSNSRVRWMRYALRWFARLGGLTQQNDVDGMYAPQHSPSSSSSSRSSFDSMKVVRIGQCLFQQTPRISMLRNACTVRRITRTIAQAFVKETRLQY